MTCRKVYAGLFGLLFPDTCRVCERPLKETNRYPVCAGCLAAAEPAVADYFCVACRMPFANPYPLDEQGLCGLCRRGLYGFDAAYSYGFYDGALRKLIHVFKYEGIETLAKPLARLLITALPMSSHFDLAVPVPMHWLRRWRRGFNQAQALAREVGRRLHIPVIAAVRRTKLSRPQAGLSLRERRQNVTASFQVRRSDVVAGKRVLLIDDVLTTGATASACAATLKRAGAQHVTVLTLARADRRIAPALSPASEQTMTATTGRS